MEDYKRGVINVDDSPDSTQNLESNLPGDILGFEDSDPSFANSEMEHDWDSIADE